MNEQHLLYGLPYVQQLTYLRGLRPYMNFSDGVVGIKRGISHQSIAEELYVEPHSGIKSGKPSREQVRRSLSGLVRAGLLQRLSRGKKLIFKCVVATTDFSVRNKADRKATVKGDCIDLVRKRVVAGAIAKRSEQVDIELLSEADTPPGSGKEDTLSYQSEKLKCVLPRVFFPSAEMLAQAKFMQCDSYHQPDEVVRFMAYHRAQGTTSCNWDATYLIWLLRAKAYHTVGLKHEKESVNAGSRERKNSKRQQLSALDRVMAAHHHEFEGS